MGRSTFTLHYICDNFPFYHDHMQKAIIFHSVRLITAVIRRMRNDACSHRFSLRDLESSLQQHGASDSSDSVDLVTLAAFHGHIDFSPTLQIIAGCCESYPPRAAGRSFCSVLTQEWLSDLRNVILGSY